MSEGKSEGDAYYGPKDRPWTEVHALLDGSRFGVVEGVTFDLRHETIPSWAKTSIVVEFECKLLFSSECKPGEKRLRIPLSLQDVYFRLEPGDTISIAEVEHLIRGGGALADQHDNEEWLAHLVLERSNGERVELEHFMRFVSRTAMGPYPLDFKQNDEGHKSLTSRHAIHWEKIGNRLNRIRSLGVVGGNWFSFAERSFEYASELYKECIKIESFDHLEDLLVEDFERQVVIGLYDYAHVVDAVAATSYALAMSEMELGIKPLALEGLKAKASRQPAHNARRRAGDPVRAAAKEYILENPKTSQGACARHVSQLFERDGRAVNRTIADMFEERTTDKGVKEKRPKPEFLTKTKAPG